MYDKKNPFPAAIKERHLVSKRGSQRHTYHVVLDLEGSNFTYAVGDSIGVIPTNDPVLVANTLRAMRATGQEMILEKNAQLPTRLVDFLSHRANLGQFSRKLISEIARRQPADEKRELLEKMLGDEHHNALKAYQEQRQVWDFLEEQSEAYFAPQELSLLLMPLLPRLYSIASSQDIVGSEVHLTVSNLIYHSNGYERKGVATSFLCERAALHAPIVPVYIQPHHGFTLPDSCQAPLIMIGPGTGVAPFRAFMQAREAQRAEGPCWLFFGEWHQAYDFFYEEFWASLPFLHVTTAFSRDQDYKIYVQDRLIENGAEIYQWLQRGAYLYVCGDAHRMAKDVDAALHKVIEMHGELDAEGARKMVKQLRSDKRYLRDIY